MKLLVNSGRDTILIDKEDYSKVKDYVWSIYKQYRSDLKYAVITNPTIRMHRLILGLADSSIRIDHINHNGLDNRKKNLRIASGTQNLGNARPQKGRSSMYKGVRFHEKNKNWTARIQFRKKQYYLGSFSSELEAACAYDKAAKELFEEFAYTNSNAGLI